MRMSSRTRAAMKNHRHTVEARRQALPTRIERGLVTRGENQVKDVAPDVRALIDEALARRGDPPGRPS